MRLLRSRSPGSTHAASRLCGNSSDEQELRLVRRIAHQDRAAFKELYCIYHRRLLRFVMRMTSRHDLAEEVMNDTMWVVWNKAGEFRAASQVSTWILGIAYRQTLASARRVPLRAMDVEIEDTTAVADDLQGQAEVREWLDHGLAQLPLEQRMVLELTYYLGYSCEEIATIMDCPVNTVKTRMFHARRKLKTGLAQLAGAAAQS